MEVIIKELTEGQSIPYHLLLLADPSKEMVDNYIKRGICYTASFQDEVIGVFVILTTKPETMEIANVAVREDFQGLGIGKKLVLSAVEKAKEKQAKTIEVGTGNSSVNQIALYQKCGFRIVGIDQDFFIRNYSEEIFENGIQCRDMIRFRLDI